METRLTGLFSTAHSLTRCIDLKTPRMVRDGANSGVFPIEDGEQPSGVTSVPHSFSGSVSKQQSYLLINNRESRLYAIASLVLRRVPLVS